MDTYTDYYSYSHANANLYTYGHSYTDCHSYTFPYINTADCS